MPNLVYDDQEAQTQTDDELQKLNDLYDAPASLTTGSDIAKQKKEQAELDKLSEKDTKPEGGSDGGWKVGNLKPKAKGWWTKKKAATIAGTVSSVIGVSAFFLAPLAGPLEFIHAAQTLRIPHFSAQEDASDTRLNALMRYAKTGDVGQTRLSYLESKYYTKMTADMERAGFKADYKASFYNGMYIDTTAEKSPYRGLSDAEVQAELEKKFGAGTFEIKDGKYFLNEKSSYRQQHLAFKLISKDMGYSGVTSAIRARVLEKYGVVTWHPLKKIDKKVNQKVSSLYDEWKKERDARIKEGTKASSFSAKGVAEQDENGKPIQTEGPSSGEASKSGVRATLDALSTSKGVSVAGGVAAVAGVVCTVKTVNDNVGAIRYEQAVLPLMRQGMDMVTAGQQVMSGLDFNDTQLEFYSKLMRGKDASGKTTEWSQAASIQANQGGSGGIPLDSKVTDLLKNQKIAWLNWVNDPSISGLVGGMCSTAGTIAVGTFSLAIGIISGGVVSTLAGAITSSVLTGPIIDKVSDLLSGDAVDTSVVGAQLGAQADIGTKLAADFAAMQMGGEVLTNAQTAELNSATKESDLYAFSRLPLKERLFNLSDNRSLVGKLFDSSPKTKSEVGSDIASLASNSFATISRNMASLVPRVSAESLQYDYGIPKFGYSLNELYNDKYSDPYANAESAAALFESGAGSEYITRALDCYGVSISKGSDGWGAVSSQDGYKTYFQKGERDAKCTDSSNENWMKTRFFIFDTGVLEAYACLQGDGQSCSNSGFGVQEATASPGSVGGNIPTGTSAELAKQILDSPNLSFQTSQGESNFKEIAQTGGQKYCGGFQEVSPTLLGTILALSQKYKIVLGVFISGHACNSGDHPKGKAVDINGVNPLSGSGGSGNTLQYGDYRLPIVKEFYVDVAKTLSANGGGKINQLQCFAENGASPPNVSSYSGVYTGYLVDPCTHLHMAVTK